MDKVFFYTTKSLANAVFTRFLTVTVSTVWCGKRDLNPYVKDTRPSNVPVCQFQHCRIFVIYEGLNQTFSLIIIS